MPASNVNEVMSLAPRRAAPTRTVLYVNPTSDGSPLLVELVKALHPETVRFTVCALDHAPGALDGQLAPLGVSIHRLGAAGTRRAPLATARLCALLRHLNPDVVHTNMFVPGIVGEIARRASRSGVPSVFTRHHDLSHHLAGKAVHVRLDALTARSATLVVAPSQAVRHTLVVREGVAADEVSVVPHGLDLAGLTPSADEVDTWRRKYAPGPLLVCASRLDPLKGFATLFQAVRRVAERHQGVQLAVAGAAVEGYKQVVHKQAREAGVADRVHLLGHVTDVHALIAAGDVYVSASEAEAFGLSVLEAAALGVPLAVTTPGGVREIVTPEYPVLEPGDHAALAAAICARLENKSQTKEVAARSALRVRTAYRPDRMVEGYAAAYERAAASRGLRRRSSSS